jgi:methanethiol S-methyltransferase
MKKILVLIYSVASYMIGMAAIVYYIGFIAGAWVPKHINSAQVLAVLPSLLINIALMVVFSLQHSIMARRGFKQWIKKHIPEAAERSTYILITSVMLGLIYWLWQPITIELYDIRGTAAGMVLWGLYGTGWFVAVFSTFLIDHFDLFGLKQAWYHVNDRNDFSYRFQSPLFYKLVRHPIYTGWLMVHWFTPHMTAGHLLLATLITLYIYIGIAYEEQDLLEQFGYEYETYREQTPRLLPVNVISRKKSA